MSISRGEGSDEGIGVNDDLGEFLRTARDEIISEWERSVRALPSAQPLDRPALIDHIPQLLNQISTMTDDLACGMLPEMPIEVANLHAHERLDAGFDVKEVVSEYSVLRDCILRLWARRAPQRGHRGSLRVLNLAIDRAVSASVDSFVSARNRTLQALDQIGAAALESGDLHENLRRLLNVMRQTAPSVDTAAILLREGDVLKVRATVGLDRDIEENLTIPVGQGYAGRIAALAQPLLLQGAEIVRVAISPALRQAGLKVLYGVPMVHEGHVIGVAHIGSLTAAHFSEQDKRLFVSMSYRASAGLVRHMLHEELQRTAFTAKRHAEFADQLLGVVGHDLRNPIAAIDMTAEALLRQNPTDRIRRGVERIAAASRRAGTLVTDLLDMARTRLGRGIPLQTSRIDIATIAESAIDEIRIVHPDREVQLASHGDTRGHWDAARLGQVCTNLVHNALKYSPCDTPIRVDVFGDDEGTSLSVHNDGPPIDATLLDHIFEPMCRGPVSADEPRQNVSLGLGLYIVKSIVDAHGGRCTVASNAESGTTFTVWLPRLVAADAQPAFH